MIHAVRRDVDVDAAKPQTMSQTVIAEFVVDAEDDLLVARRGTTKD